MIRVDVVGIRICYLGGTAYTCGVGTEGGIADWEVGHSEGVTERKGRWLHESLGILLLLQHV